MAMLLLLACVVLSGRSLAEEEGVWPLPGPLDYIRGVFSKLSRDGEGRPRDLVNGPTSVWLLQDTGTLNNASNYRNSTSRQSGEYEFLFDWSSLPKGSDGQVDRGVIRMHLRSPSEWRRSPSGAEDAIVVITANVSVGVLSDCGGGLPALRRTASIRPGGAPSTSTNFTVFGNYSEWVEVDITGGLRVAWVRDNASVVAVTVQLSAAATSAEGEEEREEGEAEVPPRFVPAEIVDPMSVCLGERRSGYTSLQPLLLVYLEELSLKTRAMVLSSAGPDVGGDRMLHDEAGTGTAARVSRRSSSSSSSSSSSVSCSLSNYTVNFGDIGIDSVLEPVSLNVGMCSGRCTALSLRQMPTSSVTHHAIVVAAEEGLRGASSTSSSREDVTCCSPISYQPVYMVLISDSIVRLQMFTDMVVRACGCG